MKILPVILAFAAISLAARAITPEEFSRRENAALARAMALYPDANVDSSRLFRLLTVKKAEMTQANPEFFKNPEWPLPFVARLANSIGIRPIIQPENTPQVQAGDNSRDVVSSETFVVLDSDGHDSTGITGNKACRWASKGDCFPFIRQDNSRIWFLIEGVGEAFMPFNEVHLVKGTRAAINAAASTNQEILAAIAKQREDSERESAQSEQPFYHQRFVDPTVEARYLEIVKEIRDEGTVPTGDAVMARLNKELEQRNRDDQLRGQLFLLQQALQQQMQRR